MLTGLAYLALQVQQSDFYPLITIYAFLFGAYLFIYHKAKPAQLGFWLLLAIAMRLFLVWTMPLLSDDVYRFIWDGRLIVNGYNPFNYLPSTLIEQGPEVPGLTRALYESLNSPNYYTIYPPIAQATFATAVWLFPHSIYGEMVVMKLFLFGFELGSIWLILRLLLHWQLPLKNVLLYALNPLVIIEVSGNLHYEGAMVFFLLLAIWLLTQNRRHWSAVMMAFSVAAKLLPLMFFPFLVKRLGRGRVGAENQVWQGLLTLSNWKKRVFRTELQEKTMLYVKDWFSIDYMKNTQYFLLCFTIIGLLFSPLMNDVFIQNFSNSLGLYFQKFEFNASVYYLFRWLGFQIIGYNIIATIGPILAMGTLSGILLMFILERNPSLKNLATRMLWAICLYLLFTTTVHPWYTCLPIVLCVFTRFRFPIIWSGLIYLTYINYSYPSYFENLFVVGIEYGVVVLFFFIELRREKDADPIKAFYHSVW